MVLLARPVILDRQDPQGQSVQQVRPAPLETLVLQGQPAPQVMLDPQVPLAQLALRPQSQDPQVQQEILVQPVRQGRPQR